MAWRVAGIEPPGSPATMIRRIARSRAGSIPCLRAVSPRYQAYEGVVQVVVGLNSFRMNSNRSEGMAPAQMHRAPSLWAPITSGPPTNRVKFRACTYRSVGRMPVAQKSRACTSWNSSKSRRVKGLRVGTPVEPLEAATNTISRSGTATMSPRSG